MHCPQTPREDEADLYAIQGRGTKSRVAVAFLRVCRSALAERMALQEPPSVSGAQRASAIPVLVMEARGVTGGQDGVFYAQEDVAKE